MSETLIPLLELVSKLLIYLGSAAVIGGGFTLILAKEQPGLIRFIKRYMLAGALMAMFAVGVNFYAQVGSFAESGWEGMFDAIYIAMLWDSPIGNSVILRVCALGFILFLLLLALLYPFNISSPMNDSLPGLLVMFIASVSASLLAFSYSLIGHTSGLNLISRLLISLHVLIALWWLGSLLPLWRACRHANPRPLQKLMYRFGKIAMGLVVVLLVCGGILAYQLLGSASELISTSYGLMLLAKVGVVAVILSFAAWHKLRLVPQLTGQTAVLRLQRSIGLEGFVGLVILFVTVLLTTVVGPDAMH